MLNKIEQLFKNRFKNKPSTQGVDVEDLWTSIADNLEEEASVIAGPSRASFWSLLLLLLFIPTSAFFYYYKQQQISPIQKKQHTPFHSINKNTSQSIVSSQALPAQIEFKTTLIKEKSATEVNNKLSINRGYSQKAKASIHKISPLSNTIQTTPLKSRSAQENQLTSTQIQAGQFNTEANANDLAQTNLPKGHLAQTIKTLYFSPSRSQSTAINFPKHASYKKEDQPKKRTKPSFEVGLLAGLNTVYTQYKADNSNDLAKELPQVLSNNIGNSYALSLSYLLGAHYSINSGLEYSLTQNIFKISHQRTTTIVDSINIQRNALEIREVVHHNKFKSISIPLSFGVRKQLNKFNIGLNMGVSYNFFIAQKGKSINDLQDIIAFDGNDQTVTPFKSSFFAFEASPFIGFKATDRMSFRFMPQFKYQLQGQSNLYGLDQNSFYFGINGGLILKF